MKNWIQRHATPSELQEIRTWNKVSKKKLKRIRNRALKAERKQAMKRTKEYLVGFWKAFNQLQSNEDRLELLKRAANPGWARASAVLRKSLRSQFQSSKFRFLAVPIEHCATCDGRHSEMHHIVPLCFGGTNHNENLLYICEDCHNAIHPWMKEG